MNTNTVKKHNKQIVTVAVITYHSAATVLETLDSIVNQTYGPENIELIISDDGSKDNTVQVINDWLAQYKIKFNDVKFFANEVNGGISKNCNIVWKAATSEWIKTIAGDDLLTINALDDLVAFICKQEGIDCVFGLVKKFPIDDAKLYPTKDSYGEKFFNLDAKKQFEALLIGNVPHAPASFISKKSLKSIGYADLQFKNLDDYPLWLKLTSSGYKLYLMKCLVVKYRVSESISLSFKNAININLNNEVRRCVVKYSLLTGPIKKYLIFVDVKMSYFNNLIILHIFKNRKSFFTKALKIMSPLGLLRRLRLFI
ncbi:glycosyltransferase family 2 protein [Shewanella sp. NKUCC06_TVS]|uniref:glycosyltransferase family 2 protein n=1 Tax=Shewanella sp. NKUCC06_TVS TaxID=2842128 RepID=UPI001C5B2E5C|nr:glycosyltransferase family 2 protein [Shewanella sp. NKUCC06_TVS]MBW3530946.1 glycosyltransferase [Shewanella sp. NKUCC06_TVS]